MLRIITTILLAITLLSGSGAAGAAATKASDPAENWNQRCRPFTTGWQAQGCENGELAVYNLLELQPGRLIWNGVPIGSAKFRRYLALSRRLSPTPGIVLVVHPGAAASTVRDVRLAITRRLACGVTHACVEYSSAEWKQARSATRRSGR